MVPTLGNVGEKEKIIKGAKEGVSQTLVKPRKFDGKWKLGATPREYTPLGGFELDEIGNSMGGSHKEHEGLLVINWR